MFGIGSTEFLVILLVALVVLGPRSLAGVTKTLGKAMGEFRRVSTEFQRTLNAEVDKEEERDRRRAAESRSESTAPSAETKAAEPAAPVVDASPAKSLSLEKPASADASPAASGQDAPVGPQPDANSPIAQALAKARAEADGVSAPTTSTAGTGGTAA